MTQKSQEPACQIICWSLSALAGILIALAASGPLPVLVAVVIGLACAFGMGVLMQRHICGVAFDNLGPFEGLKGVPGWDEDGPHDPPGATKRKASPPSEKPDASASRAQPSQG